jgi:hypothetical protein
LFADVHPKNPETKKIRWSASKACQNASDKSLELRQMPHKLPPKLPRFTRRGLQTARIGIVVARSSPLKRSTPGKETHSHHLG